MQRLGQHFLKNKSKIRKIVEALELGNGDTVIEIGAGHGEITENLKSQISNLKIVAIEKDSVLAEKLKQKYKNDEKIEIAAGDVLKILPSIIHNSKFIIQNYKIVGNIPYYITGRLLRVVGELKIKPKITVLTVQKEVAERICVQPPKMNLLAVSIQFWAKPEIIDFISKKDFKPQPKVDSAIIKLVTRNQEPVTSNANANYYKLIKILFKQPRKTILNNLKSGLKLKNEELLRKLSELNVNLAERPQNLGIEPLKKLAEIVYN